VWNEAWLPAATTTGWDMTMGFGTPHAGAAARNSG
jgi:hypothetical protein